MRRRKSSNSWRARQTPAACSLRLEVATAEHYERGPALTTSIIKRIDYRTDTSVSGFSHNSQFEGSTVYAHNTSANSVGFAEVLALAYSMKCRCDRGVVTVVRTGVIRADL